MLELARPSSALAPSDTAECYAIASAGKQFCNEQVTALLRACKLRCQPLLFAYQSDGWGVNTATVNQFKVGNRWIKREGYKRSEFILELSILKTIDPSDHISMALGLPDQTQLRQKSGDVIFQKACDSSVIFCSKDHNIDGMVIHLYLQDGLHAKSMCRRMRARHHLYHTSVCASDFEEADLQRHNDSNLVLGFRCISHSVSSACGWALVEFKDRDILKATHVVIKSCINTSWCL